MDPVESIDWTGFDVPELRKQDVRWLLRNLAVRNSDHPRFEAVQEILRKGLT